MNQAQSNKSSIMSVIMFIFTLILIGGCKTVFKACTEKSGGNFMTCHWAEQTIFVIAIAMAVIALLAIIVGDSRAKAAYSLAEIPLAVATAFTPQYIIPLCIGADMRCKTIMQPAIMIISAVIAVIALISFIVYRVRGSKDKKAVRNIAFEEGKAEGKASVQPEVKPVTVMTSTAAPKEAVAEPKQSVFTREEEPIKLEAPGDLNAELFPAADADRKSVV